MLISVIIPVYNSSKTIERTLSSVFDQGFDKSEMEIILINDGSTDNSEAIIQKYADRCVIQSTGNYGVSFARNLGYTISTGEYIQYLDSDDLLVPDKLKVQMKALELSGTEVAYSDWRKFRESNGEIHYLETIERSMKGRPEIELFTDFWCPPAALLYRRAICERIGGWNTTLPVIQDARYFLDAALNGSGFVYTPGILAYYRVSESGSLSTRSAIAFITDCYVNASQVYEIWKNDLKEDSEKKNALINTLRYCATNFSVSDKKKFKECVDLILTIQPGFIPESSRGMHYLSTLLGYRKAERIAALKRKLF